MTIVKIMKAKERRDLIIIKHEVSTTRMEQRRAITKELEGIMEESAKLFKFGYTIGFKEEPEFAREGDRTFTYAVYFINVPYRVRDNVWGHLRNRLLDYSPQPTLFTRQPPLFAGPITCKPKPL